MHSWPALLSSEKRQQYFIDTIDYVEQRRDAGTNVYPERQDVFNAFDCPTFANIKVVILGQDPYHGQGQAHGLCFSVKQDIKIPPSLRNIYKELATDIDNFTPPNHGNLQHWAKQGVMLLNTVLTVEEGQAHSHKHLGWEQFTDKVIELINLKKQSVVFILWGAHAQKKGRNIDNNKHLVLNGPHPSPLSAHRGFFGCKHFSQTNEYLVARNKSPIDWNV